jgi:hypothetical protein
MSVEKPRQPAPLRLVTGILGSGRYQLDCGHIVRVRIWDGHSMLRCPTCQREATPQ